MSRERKIILLIIVGIITIILIAWAALALFSPRDRGSEEEGNLFDIPIGDRTFEESSEEEFAFTNTLREGDLVLIAAGPIASASIKTIASSTILVSSTSTEESRRDVWYVEKKSGNIFSYTVETGETERLSNTLIPGVRRAVWLPENNIGIDTYDSDELYLGTITASGEFDGRFLDRDIRSLVALGTSTMAALSKNGSGSLVQELTMRETSLRDIARTPLTEVTLLPSSKNSVALLSKPSGSLHGVLEVYEVGKEPVRLAGGNGLTALLDEKSAWVFIGRGDKKTATLSLLNRATREETLLPIATLPEKCMWVPGRAIAYCAVPLVLPMASYPDYWYQGAVSFEDALWEIDAEEGRVELVRSFTKKEGVFDITQLAIDERATYLTFINKKDGTLWGLGL